MSEQRSSPAHLLYLPYKSVGNQEYSKAITPEIINEYAELGVSTQIIPILARHLADLNLVTDGISETSSLMVGAIKNGDDNSEWRRYLRISERQYARYVGFLEDVSVDQDLPDRSFEKIGGIATRWIYYELSADVLSNSCYMQSKFNKYIPDYNGNSPHYRSDLLLSRRFLSERLDGEPSLHLLEYDQECFKAGVGIAFLKNAILRAGMLKREKQAEWFVRRITDHYPTLNDSRYPIEPVDQYGILDRLEYAQPVEGVVINNRRFAEMIEDPDDDDY